MRELLRALQIIVRVGGSNGAIMKGIGINNNQFHWCLLLLLLLNIIAQVIEGRTLCRFVVHSKDMNGLQDLFGCPIEWLVLLLLLR